MCIAQTRRHALDQLDLVVESFRHAVGVAMPHEADNRLEPTRQRPRDTRQRRLGALRRALTELHKRLSGWFVLLAMEPLPQVLPPIQRFTSLWTAPAPVVTGDARVHIQVIGGLAPAFAQLLQLLSLVLVALVFDRAQHAVTGIHSLLDHMETVDAVHLIAKALLEGSGVRLGHLQHHHCDSGQFLLRTASAPRHDIVGTSALQRHERRALVPIDHQGVGAMPLAPGVCINADDAAELAGTPTTTSFTRPAEHAACGEAVTTGACLARTPPQQCLSHLVGEALSPRCTCAERLALLPGSVLASAARKAPHMQPQHGGPLQDRQGAQAPQSALFDAGAARLASGTHDGVLAAFEMQLKLCGAKHLSDDATCWASAQRCDTMEIHAHRALLLGGFSWKDSPRIVRDIRCVSMSASEPLVIEPRHWPQTWRRAHKIIHTRLHWMLG